MAYLLRGILPYASVYARPESIPSIEEGENGGSVRVVASCDASESGKILLLLRA